MDVLKDFAYIKAKEQELRVREDDTAFDYTEYAYREVHDVYVVLTTRGRVKCD